jgi:hypothetical protein
LALLSAQTYLNVSESIQTALETQSKEFNRRLRSLEYLSRWKASEFRTFLIYECPVALKALIADQRKDVHESFLLLSEACRICSFKEFDCCLRIAEEMFENFVEQFTNVFGVENTTWKVHSTLHMVDEVRRHGVFHEFSAYEFESFMNTIKTRLHHHACTLQQLHRRTVEIHKSSICFSKPRKKAFKSRKIK